MELGDLGKMFGQLQDMQKNMEGQVESFKNEISNIKVIGRAGVAPADVKLIMLGNRDCERVSYGDTFEAQPKNVKQELMAAAINDANRRLEEALKEKMGDVTKNFKLPEGMNFPFGNLPTDNDNKE